MMNLKYFYYRGYFDDNRLRLFQPAEKTEREPLEKINQPVFREKNKTLTSTARVKPFSPANLEKIGAKELRLIVQNPGLLPGIGYPHEVGYPGEFKLGFGFDHTTGLPVLPGSSVKGVLRSVFPQVEFDGEYPHKMTKKPDSKQKNKAKYLFDLLNGLGIPNLDEYEHGQQDFIHSLELAIFCGFDFSEKPEKKRRPMPAHDVFFDALPVRFLENQLLGRDALAPHLNDPLKNPVPLPFVKVMPGVTFGFYFKLRDTRIGKVEISGEQKRRLFAEILCTVGAGAKTNVGYGQFEAENAGDRILKPGNIGALTSASNVITGKTAVPQPKRWRLEKLRRYDKIVGEVVEVVGNLVRFRLPDVDGFDGLVEEKIPATSLIERFAVGKKFELAVSDVLIQKKVIIAKVSNYSPLP